MPTINQNSVEEVSHAEEMETLIGEVPKKIVMVGMSVFGGLLLVFIAFAWFIRYPDIISAPMTLRATNSPKAVIAHSNGKIVKLFVSAKQSVQKGQVLGYLESTGDHKSVLRLSGELAYAWQNVQNSFLEQINFDLKSYYNLGELQPAYQNFYSSYSQFNSMVRQRVFARRRQLLISGKRNYDSLGQNLISQREILNRDYDLASDEFTAQNHLYDQKVISISELRKEQSRLLSKKMPIENINAALLNNQNSKDNIASELIQTEKEFLEMKASFIQSLNKMINDVEAWKREFLLVAPTDRVLSFPQPIEENQDVAVNQPLLFVLPAAENYYGEMYVAQTNFGKIEKGQKVSIQLEGFPFQEYGSLTGIVEFISDIPNSEKKYLVKVKLSDGLITEYGKTIRFSNGLNANGRITTSSNRLLLKFFQPLKNLKRD